MPITTKIIYNSSYRILSGYYAKNIDDSVLPMNNHLTEDEPQETLFQPNNVWLTAEKGTKLYILAHLDNIILSRSQYIATSIMNYGPYIDNLFALVNHQLAQMLPAITWITDDKATHVGTP